MQQNEWAAKKVQEVRARHERQQEASQLRLLEEKQKQVEGPKLWDEFVLKVQQRVEAFNQDFGSQAIQAQQVRQGQINLMIGNTNAPITAEYRPERPEIRCMLVGSGVEYRIDVVGGKVTLTRGARLGQAIPVTTDDAVESFVNSLIDSM